MKKAGVSISEFCAGLCLVFLIAGCPAPATTNTTGTGGSGSSCPTGRTACGLDCVDTQADRMNCGACGIPCSSGQVCQGGVCQCQSGMLCNGACVPSDATHCGNCTTVCPANQVCSNNACSASCGGAQTLCGTACVDTTSSNANCGSCGQACGSTQHCANSVCVDNTTTGSGGGNGSGGTTGSGGSIGPGGTTGSGGSIGPGGTTGSGGRGGTTGSGGATATGGGTATGGAAPTLRLVTSAPGAYWQTTGALTEVTAGTADVTVNDATMAQTWEGFGGSFNEMGWNYLSMLSQADRDRAIQLLYGAEGARFTFGRIPIGSSDYGMDRYTLDESANDTALANFSISRDMMKLIPFIKAAQAVKANIRFWGSPWTPPTWMKSSPFQAGNVVSPFDGGTMKNDDATMKAFAQYLLKFVQAYGAQNITVEAVAPQNEPNYGQNYPSCIWPTATFTTFVGKYLGPAFTAAGSTAKIMLGTMSNPDAGKDPAILSGVMADATAKPYVKVIGLQWGMITSVASAKSYNLPIWQTEHRCGNYPWMTGYVASAAPNDQAYGVESWGLIRDWIKAGVTAYSAWNMVLDTVGKGIDTTRDWAQNALLTVNTSSKTLNLTPTYYVFRHLSQFVETGAKVVATTGGDALAFKNPNGTIVTVMYNSGGAKMAIVAAAGKKFQFAMPGTGWATVISQ